MYCTSEDTSEDTIQFVLGFFIMIIVHIVTSFDGFIMYDITDIDDCTSARCENGGSCVDQVNGYGCNCVGGYTGTLCQTGTRGRLVPL